MDYENKTKHLLLDFNFSIYYHSIIQRYDFYSWGIKEKATW